MSKEGLQEILKAYKKSTGKPEEETTIKAKVIQTNELGVKKEETKGQKEQQTEAVVETTGGRPIREYVVAKEPSDYFREPKTIKIEQRKELEREVREVFKDNGIVLIRAVLDSSQNSYNVIEQEPSLEENGVIEKYEQLHKLSEYVSLEGPLTSVYNKIKQVMIDFIENINKTGLVRPEVVSYYLMKKYTYFELTPLLWDRNIEDINGIQDTNIVIHDSKYLNDFVVNIFLSKDKIATILKKFSEFGKEPITPQKLNVSVTLPEGSRFNCIYPFENEGKISFSIRKQVFTLISPQQSLSGGFITVDEMTYLAWVMEHSELGKIGFIGLPGVGKTSALKTMSLFIPMNSRIFSIETTPELILKQKSWAQNVYVYDPVNQIKLINASLQYRPDYLIIGEIKIDRELIDNLFSAMSSGFKTMFTLHSENTTSFISKLQSRQLEIAKDRIANINYLVFMVEDKSIKKRYISNIDEIYGYDASTDSVLYQTIVSSKMIFKNNKYQTLSNVGYTSNKRNTELYKIYDTFIQLEKINYLKPISQSGEFDALLMMILKSKTIENYARIYGIGEENPEYREPQLRFSKEYHKIYDEMRDIRMFLVDEYFKYSQIKETNEDYDGIDDFLID
ncbi:MAG: type II/IV secretion system ATPase subunit, partial [Saccharolobus sp.]